MDNSEIARRIAQLKNPEDAIRRHAMQALGEMGESAVPALIETFTFNDPGVRKAVIETLAMGIGVCAVPTLLEALKIEYEAVRIGCIEALGGIGDAGAVAALCRMLQDKNSAVRLAAIAALEQIGTRPAYAALIRILTDQNSEVKQRAFTALLKNGILATPSLVEALKHENTTLRTSAAELLSQIADPSALAALVEALKDSHRRVRQRAAEALNHIGDARAVPALLDALKDGDLDVRKIVAVALGNSGDLRSVSPLLDRQREEDWADRNWVAEALCKLGDAHLLPRRILAAAGMTAQERTDLLERLRRGYYRDSYGMNTRYTFPATRKLCEEILEAEKENEKVRAGAQAVLKWLKGDHELLRASHSDSATDRDELLRGHQGNLPEPQPETLLRPTEEPPTLWQQWFGKKTDG